MRKRYLRGSTSSTGHGLPLTIMKSAKIEAVMPSGGSVVVDKSRLPSSLNQRSWKSSSTS